MWIFNIAVWSVVWFALLSFERCCLALRWLGMALVALYIADWIVKAVYNFMPRKLISDVSKKAVFITGCDSGFGLELANRLHDLGFTVYAGCLRSDSEGAKRINSRLSDFLKVVQLDVTKNEDVTAAYKFIENDIRKKEENIELWAVVNNAGIAAYTEIEWCPVDMYKQVLEVNSIGPVRVTKTFLPALRKSQGRIIIVASLAGRYTFPGFTAYSMSKHATVSFADGLRLEMKKWNISVHLVEPTLYRTPISNEERLNSTLDEFWKDCPNDVRESYGSSYLEAFKTAMIKHMNRAKPSEKVKEVIDDLVDAVAGLKPKSRYVPSVETQIRARVLSSLPTEVLDNIFLKSQPQTPPAFSEKLRRSKLQDPRQGGILGKPLLRGYSMPNYEKSHVTPSPTSGKREDIFKFNKVEETVVE